MSTKTLNVCLLLEHTMTLSRTSINATIDNIIMNKHFTVNKILFDCELKARAGKPNGLFN